MSASSSTLPPQVTPARGDVIMTDDTMQPSVPTVEITSTVPSKGKKVITKEDWKWLQPIVSRLYIHENLTFLEIEAKLRSDYDFYLSRRTFTKKIDNWGLKKNLRPSERNELLKLGPKHEKFRGDRRLKNEARLKRLQKRYGGDSSLLGRCNYSRSDDMEIDEVEERTTSIHSQQLHQNDPLPHVANLDDKPQLSDDEAEEIIPQHSDIDTSTSNRWYKSVNVDELTATLKKLGFQGVCELLAPHKNPADFEDSDSDLEPQQLPRAGTSDTQSCSIQEQLVEHRIASRNIQNRKIRNLTFSPSSEISVFPARPKKASRMTWDTYVGKMKREWPMEQERLRSKLESSTLCNKERISTLDHLVSLGNSMLIENISMSEELLAALKSETKCDRRRITKTYFHLIENCINNSQFQKVAKHFRGYLTELQSDETTDFAKLELLYLQAYYLYRLGYFKKAENIIRRAIWCALTYFGPYHDLTIRSLDLSILITETITPGHFVEGEDIRRFNLSIYNREVTDFNFYLWADNAFSLLRHFIRSGRYEEGQSLCTYITKRAKLAFGTESLPFTQCQMEQANIWQGQGKSSEALDLLHPLSGNSIIGDKTRYAIFHNIAYIQYDMKDFPEAAIWFRKSFESTVMMFGLQHPDVLVNCWNLGRCFENLGRWEAALRLYSKFAERLRGCRGVDPSSVGEVEGWISDVEETIEWNTQEKKSKRDGNADGGVNIDGVGYMDLGQSQDRTDLDVDWDVLKDIPTPEWYSE